jgi:hypothetical protein
MTRAKHVEPNHTGDRLVDILRCCTHADRDENQVEDSKRALLQFPVIDIVKGLGEFLLSDDSSVRREAVSVLSWMIKIRADIDAKAIPFILAFFCGRLGDWSSVEFAVQGIRELYMKHISPSGDLVYAPEEDSVRLRERSDLSLMLGYTTVADLPAETGSVTERVLTKLLINVHAPSFGKQVRYEVLSLLKLLIKDHSAQLLPISELIIKGVAIEGEDERDPLCLSVFFECIELLFETGLIPSEDMTSIDELFSTLKSYFPIETTNDLSPEEQEMTEKLKLLQNRCFVRFGLRSIEFLVPQLEDRSRVEETFRALELISRQRPSDLLPFLVGDWTRRSPPLLGRLIQIAVTASEEEFITTFISHICARGDIELVALVGNSGKKWIEKIIEFLVKSGAEGKLFSLVPLLDFNSIDALSVEGVDVNKLVDQLLGCEKSENLLPLVSRLVPSITDSGLAGRVAALAWESEDDFARTVTHLVAGKWALASLSEIFDMEAAVKKLVSLRAQSALSKIYPKLPARFLEYLNSDFDLIIDALEDAHFCERFLEFEGDSFLSPKVIGRITRTTCDPVFVRKHVIGNGSFAALAHMQGCAVVVCQAIRSEGEFLDLLAAVISAIPGKEETKNAIEIVITARGDIDIKKILEIVNHCQDDDVWASAVRALPPNRIVAQQLTEKRAEAVLLFPDLVEQLVNEPGLPVRVLTRLLTSPMIESVDSAVCEKCVIESLENGDEFGFKLCVKYAVLNPNLTPEFLEKLAEKLIYLLHSERAIIRFGAAQTIATLPEMVASGKLKSLKDRILAGLDKTLQREPKFAVRKQIAIGITSWYNIS